MIATLTHARPRVSTLDRPTLMRLAETEYGRFASALRELDGADWDRTTNCPGWTVRDMAGHCLGMAEMASSIKETIRQQRLAGKRGGIPIDALTGLQVEEHATLSTSEVLDRFAAIGPKAARARRRTPGLVRARRLPGSQIVGGKTETWTIGFLMDTILTRDPWMHRLDIALATGRPPVLTPDHDAVIVADVVNEWAARHGQAVQLTLTGPAGGRWQFGAGGPDVALDAIEFIRAVSGRAPAVGLLETQVPF